MLKSATLFILAASVALATAQTDATIPAPLLSMAKRPPLEVALLLANTSVPSGIEIHESDDLYPTPAPDFSLPPAARIPASDVVRAFNAAHSDYQARLMDGVFVIRPTNGRLEFLDMPSAIRSRAAIIGTTTAERRIFSHLDAELLQPVASSVGGWAAANGLTAHVILDGTRRRVIDTMNQIVQQVPGAWQVTTRQDGDETRIVSFGYIYTNGSRVTHRIDGS